MALRRFLIKPSEAAIRDLYRALTTPPPNDVQAQPDDPERVTAGTLGVVTFDQQRGVVGH
jgi:hypothetical protein